MRWGRTSCEGDAQIVYSGKSQLIKIIQYFFLLELNKIIQTGIGKIYTPFFESTIRCVVLNLLSSNFLVLMLSAIIMRFRSN